MFQFQKSAQKSAALVMAALCIAGCSGNDAEVARQAQAKAQAFAATQKTWRDERRARLTLPDGWTSLVGLHWLDRGAHYIGHNTDNGIPLAAGPEHMGMIELTKDNAIRFVPDRDAVLTLDGAPLQGSTTLLSDASDAGPSKLGFDEGKGLLTVIKRGDRYALRVKHADAPTRTGFKGIEYWPGGPDWVVQAKFVPHPAGTTIPVVNIVGTTEAVSNPGAVEFQRDEQTWRLEALDEGDGELMLVFADGTSGKGSYPAGRFLYASMPDAKGNVSLDFNKAYNPPCAFTAYATCPLPPPENRLEKLKVEAGEKAYHYEERKSQ
ncbi:DUF1684 domain-containing protein [Lysobacter fragariae]